MIDFIKIIVSDLQQIDIIWHSLYLDYNKTERRLIKETGEIKGTVKREYRGLIFERTFDNRKGQEVIYISGSLHKYYNKGVHNANDLKMIDCINVVLDLQNKFNCNLAVWKVINLEYGVNFVPSIDSKNLLTAIRYHDRNEYTRSESFNFLKVSGSFDKYGKRNTYKVIKAYCKGIQFPQYCDQNTFRFEVKSKKARYINSLGIFTLADLLKPEIYLFLKQILLTEWQNNLILDQSFMDDPKLSKYASFDFWENSLNGHRNTFQNNRKKYKELLTERSGNLYETTTKQIDKKIRKLCAISPGNEIDGCVQIHQYIRCDNAHAKICPVANLPIINQREESKYISHGSIRYYLDYSVEVWEYLKRSFLPKDQYQADIEKQIIAIAHTIRCRATNRENKQVRLYRENQFNLLGMFGG